jgi:hypothetical protein
MSVQDVMAETRCSRTKGYELMWQLGAFGFGGNLRITRAAFDRWAMRLENTRG